MINNARILIIDDDMDVAIAAKVALRRDFPQIQLVLQLQQVRQILLEFNPDLILLDMNFSPGASNGQEGLQLIAEIKAALPQVQIIAMTAFAEIDVAVKALKAGASDFITKPWDNRRLLELMHSSLPSAPPVASSSAALDALLGESAPMRELRQTLRRIAPTEANILILGENGVGKELVAKAIHDCSDRRKAPFMALDMGSIPDTTFESELFGHKRGAFTDARHDRIGRFQAAHGGVLFLDEIGNLSLTGQAKLLTALERREVTPIGSNVAEKIDVRVVSATNLDELKLYQTEYFRSDLLYRLNTLVVRVPALRQRSEDIPLLLRHYLRFYEFKYQRPARSLSPPALSDLCAYSWPGNVRALRHACERAVIMAQGEGYQSSDFALQLAQHTTDQTTQQSSAVPLTLDLAQQERDTIQTALNQVNGNISHAAKLLGLSRAALYRKLDKYGI